MKDLIAKLVSYCFANNISLAIPKKKDSKGFIHWKPSNNIDMPMLEALASKCNWSVIESAGGFYEGKPVPAHLFIGVANSGVATEEEAIAHAIAFMDED